jgi:hypothetical protein
MSSDGRATAAAMNWTFWAELGLPGALELAEVLERAPDRHALVQAALFGQVADAIAGGARRALAQHLDVALVGKKDTHDHADRRGLARTVGADEAVDRPLGDRQAEAVDRDGCVVALGDAAERDGVGHGLAVGGR